MHTYSYNALKAAQSALFLIRKYAVDKESAKQLNEWILPYEQFAYRRIGNLESLRGKSQTHQNQFISHQ